MLQTALEHYRTQQRVTAAAVLAAEDVRQKGAAEVARVVTAFQILAARDAIRSGDAMLEEQGIDPDPRGGVAVSSVAGVASDGRPLVSLFEQADSDSSFTTMVVTQMQDAARAAGGLAMVRNFGAQGFVRMLNPPSCSRCAILAGRFYRWNRGFERHPRCDCRHIPSTESLAGDLTTDPNAYFNSLDPVDQSRIFTRDGAQAIRDGADLSQVVNARRDMYRAQNFGKDANGIYVATNRTNSGLLFSTEGTTARGRAFRSLNERFTSPDGRVRTRISGGTRYSQATNVRMMPETIYSVTDNRDEALRLLKLHGYVL